LLVCNVSLRARRVAIAASVSETATAVDATATGNVVFATLVDDPASVGDHVDAYLGQIMREAASAAATVNAGLAYAAAVGEAANAVATVNASITYAAAIVEVAGAADAPSASVVAPSIIAAAVVETATAADVPDASVTAGPVFAGVLALDGPIIPGAVAPTVIYIEG
jgi:hypothetical protein